MPVCNLSVCIIAKDEEQMLPDCLKSIKDIASEIILVDTGSQDKTIHIAESFGAKIFQTSWEQDFSKARNLAISKAKEPFILTIDADERLVNPELLIQELKMATNDTAGWLIEVLSETINASGLREKYISNLLRLFRNHPDIKFYGAIHEQISESIIKLGFKIKNTQIQFYHLGYSLSSENMQKKQIRNLEILNKVIENGENTPYNYYQRAKTYFALEKIESAENDISISIENALPKGTLKPQALNWGAMIAYKAGKIELAKIRAKKSIELLPKQTFAHFILGEIYFNEGNYGEAFEHYDAMFDTDVHAKIIGDIVIPPEDIYYKKGRTLFALKIYKNALIEFEKGLNHNPKHIPCLIGSANIAYNLKKFEEAKNILQKAYEIAPDNEDIVKYLELVNKSISKAYSGIIQKSEYSSEKDILITLSMIVKNEEKFLSGCLESVKGIVDEIVIVDTGSTDRTREIALSYNAKLYDFEWINDFSAARNEALKHSNGRWILYLDADERLSEDSRKNIRQLLMNVSEDIGGIICTLESDHSLISGKTEIHRGGYPRLFRNYGYPSISFSGRVHEQITPSILALGKSLIFSDIVIQHLGYNRSREEMEQKIKRNYSMLIQHVKEEPLNAYAWYQLGQTLAHMRLIKEAEETIKFAIESGNLSNSVYASACATLSQLTGNQKKFEEALHWAEKSLEKAPEQMYANHLKAYALMYLGRLDEAEYAFNETLRIAKKKKGVPLSGFDIVVPEEAIFKGLEELYEKRKIKAG